MDKIRNILKFEIFFKITSNWINLLIKAQLAQSQKMVLNLKITDWFIIIVIIMQ